MVGATTNIGSFSQLVGIAVERILIGAEKSYGEKAILSAVVVFPLLYDKMQHAPDGSTIGRVLRFAFCCGVGRGIYYGQLARYSPWERERRRRMVLRLRVVQVTPR